MKYDPATQAFLRMLNEDNNIKGTEGGVWDGSRPAPRKETSFKGNYGGGNDFHQMDPDTEFEDLTKRALGSDLSGLGERPGSIRLNDEEEPGDSTELDDLDIGDGAATKKGRPFAAPEGFKQIKDGLPVSKDAPGKTKPGKELGESVFSDPINFNTPAIDGEFGYQNQGGDPEMDEFGNPIDQEVGDDLAYDEIPVSDPESEGRPMGLNGPHNGIAHEGRFSALPDEVIAEAIGDIFERSLKRWDIQGDSEPLRKQWYDDTHPSEPNFDDGASGGDDGGGVMDDAVGRNRIPGGDMETERGLVDMYDRPQDNPAAEQAPHRYRVQCPQHVGLPDNGEECPHCAYLSDEE